MSTEEQLLKVEDELAVQETTYPLDVKRIVELENKRDNLKAGIKAIDAIALRLGLTDEDIANIGHEINPIVL